MDRDADDWLRGALHAHAVVAEGFVARRGALGRAALWRAVLDDRVRSDFSRVAASSPIEVRSASRLAEALFRRFSCHILPP